MGTTTNAIICYGVNFGEDLPWDREKMEEDGFGDCDKDEYLAFILGGLRLSDYDDYGDYYAAKGKCLEESGIAMVEHCHSEYSMYIIALRDTELTARRGDALDLDFGELQKKVVGGKEKIQAALRKLGHENPPEPGWILCSYWG